MSGLDIPRRNVCGWVLDSRKAMAVAPQETHDGLDKRRDGAAHPWRYFALVQLLSIPFYWGVNSPIQSFPFYGWPVVVAIILVPAVVATALSLPALMFGITAVGGAMMNGTSPPISAVTDAASPR